jgi:anti-sigma-K factor RskA
MMAISNAGEAPADRIWQRLAQRLESVDVPAEAGAQTHLDGVETKRSPQNSASPRTRNGAVRGWRIATAIVSAAAILLAMAAGILANHIVRVEKRDSSELAALQGEVGDLSRALSDRTQQVVSLRSELAAKGQLMRAVLAPDLRLIKLSPLPPAPDAAGLVAVSESRGQAVLQAAGLPQPPAGKEYELWWIGARSGPVRAAVFSPNPNGVATVASTSPPHERILASAITLEPSGGVDKPTGPMYLKGAL